MKNFSKILFHTIPEKDLVSLSECERGRILAAHMELSQKRTPGKAQISISRTQCEHPGDERTVIDIVQDDTPFLVDSIVAEINRHSLLIDQLIHPYVFATFKDGVFVSASERESDASVRQNHIHIRLHRLIPKNMEQKLKRGLKRAAIDVHLATKDWEGLRQKIVSCQKIVQKYAAKTVENEEYAAFLEYIHNNNFTLLGYRYYQKVSAEFQAQPKKSLGLLRSARDVDFLEKYSAELPELFARLAMQPHAMHIFKMNRDSSVHRRVPIDAMAVQDLEADGSVKGYHLIIGLFTSVTYSRSIMNIPYLREKVSQVLTQTNFVSGSHDDKALRHILEKYPRDELFQLEVPQLQKTALSILSLQECQRIALFLRPDLFGTSVVCLIYIPRDRFDTRMRKRFEGILEAELGGTTTSFFTTLDDSVFARVLLRIECNKDRVAHLDEDRLEKLLRQEGRAWDEALAEAINVSYGTDADELVETYSGAFPTSYRENYSPEKALNDMAVIEKLSDTQKIGISFYQDSSCQAQEFRLKLYLREEALTLSDALPILENMGLRVISELPFKVKIQRNGTPDIIWIHDFLMKTEIKDIGQRLEVNKHHAEKAFEMIWHGKMQNDSLNALVMSASMTWRDVIILRAYVHYIRQLGTPFTRNYIASALTKHPQVARLLVDMFCKRLDPVQAADQDKYVTACRLLIQDELEQVASLDEDRILRSILNLVESTLRTNFFQTDEAGVAKDYLSLKIDSTHVDGMPEPKPYREIFVYSPRMEGVHLRGGPIARGGLRWSDRPEDYRTEVLGLMKAQMVKNSVIVPVGSKGGFILRHPPKEGGRAALLEEGIACYKIFIRGLLDITDNRKGRKIIPPQNVVRHDGDDPYLVVAADKGTATFSDIANGISQEYGFWLGDAFASGGSVGYDHKKMGITARGAWESVKRHFYELNHDTQTQEFDVIGVGDMGGDVFGNGMLLSKKIRLIGAFNHLHIFCDPHPDADSSWAERKRLFESVQGWDGYDLSKLSPGGRIYSRADKELVLTDEIRKCFNISKEKVSPPELMHAMLLAKTDLLWFGGIGTYVKAENETHQQVGDKTNDAIRVNAKDLQAKVIGEGANLGVTQLARIEFAKNRGAINADFIDNSGGVDSSDHEVNIKILLQAVMEDKGSKMDLKARNKLLESMTETVAQLVLDHNRAKVEAISLMELQAVDTLAAQADLIQQYENEIGLNRKLEALPDQESVNTRLRLGKGLTRPELSTVQAYATIRLTDQLRDTSIPDHPTLRPWLITYFPRHLQKDYETEIRQHRLARDIICMKLANNIVNRMGPTFIKDIRDQTGASIEDIVRAYLISKEITGLRALWDEVNSETFTALAPVRLQALKALSDLTRKNTLWFLKHMAGHLDIEKQIAQFGGSMKTLQKELFDLLPEQLKKTVAGAKSAYISDGFPADLAQKLSLLPALEPACDIIQMALKAGPKTSLKAVAESYFQIGETFYFDWLYYKAKSLSAEDKWNRQAKVTQIALLASTHADLCEKILKDRTKATSFRLEDWVQKHEDAWTILQNQMQQIKRAGQFDLAMLTLVSGSLRNFL
ncbi:MAG: NAD-glutamate dehydrogenase [Rhodospirillales bacterium]|nr:NAD-glutamate dehydrogenase [Rhodospirillales bacterium]MCB9965655.1 NAD-glutamate dehydrogenase [Rhodospirillales bacterium]